MVSLKKILITFLIKQYYNNQYSNVTMIYLILNVFLKLAFYCVTGNKLWHSKFKHLNCKTRTYVEYDLNWRHFKAYYEIKKIHKKENI